MNWKKYIDKTILTVVIGLLVTGFCIRGTIANIGKFRSELVIAANTEMVSQNNNNINTLANSLYSRYDRLRNASPTAWVDTEDVVNIIGNMTNTVIVKDISYTDPTLVETQENVAPLLDVNGNVLQPEVSGIDGQDVIYVSVTGDVLPFLEELDSKLRYTVLSYVGSPESIDTQIAVIKVGGED